MEGAPLFMRSLDADFSDDILVGEACSSTFPGDTATPMSAGLMDFLQKLLRCSVACVAA